MVNFLNSYKKALFFIVICFGMKVFSMNDCLVKDEANEIERQTSSVIDDSCLKFLIDKNITPENTVFAFDVHEVLFDRYHSRIVWGSMKLFCKCFLYLIYHPSFLFRLIELQKRFSVFEGVHAELIKEYPFWDQFKPDIFEIANSPCYPIEPMINLLSLLKEKGFKIFMLSNMGEETWEAFKIKFDPIAELFDGFYTPSKNNNFIAKPTVEFYNGFKDYLKNLGHEDKQILFIDDIKKNIEGANKAEIAGIHFTGHKNLCEILAHLNIVME